MQWLLVAVFMVSILCILIIQCGAPTSAVAAAAELSLWKAIPLQALCMPGIALHEFDKSEPHGY